MQILASAHQATVGRGSGPVHP